MSKTLFLSSVKSETIKGEFRIPHNKKKFKSWQSAGSFIILQGEKALWGT